MTESHIVLELVIGVPKAVGDPYTNEPELDVINLLNVSGFAVEYPDGWVPQMPTMKGGGLWADSALSAGRQLIAGELGNVIETITLTATGATLETYLYLKSRLLDFGRRARAFHTDWAEMQPCYLKWHAPGGACPQYALVYAIDTAGEEDAFEGNGFDTVVITIEREPAWRMGVPPGGNPLLWTYFSRGTPAGSGYDYDDMDLKSSNSLITGTVNNRHEWLYNAGNPPTTQSSKNYIDISASQVPGDAPALVSVALGFDTTGLDGNGAANPGVVQTIAMGHSSKNLIGTDQAAGLTVASGYVMNACNMGGGGINTAGSAQTGVFNAAAVPARQYRSITFAAAPSTAEIQSNSGIIDPNFRQLLRGRFAVFMRARLTSGTSGDVAAKLTVSEVMSSTERIEVILPEVPVQTSGNAGDYKLHYMGQITLPLEAKTHEGAAGRGIYIRNAATQDVRFVFGFRNPTSLARTFEVLDFFFMPVDEGFAELRYISAAGSLTNVTQTYFMDNSGYLGRGEVRDIAMRASGVSAPINTSAIAVEQRGNLPMLLPRTNQRLYFLNQRMRNGVITSTPDADMTVAINIVPRCYGVAAL